MTRFINRLAEKYPEEAQEYNVDQSIVSLIDRQSVLSFFSFVWFGSAANQIHELLVEVTKLVSHPILVYHLNENDNCPEEQAIAFRALEPQRLLNRSARRQGSNVLKQCTSSTMTRTGATVEVGRVLISAASHNCYILSKRREPASADRLGRPQRVT